MDKKLVLLFSALTLAKAIAVDVRGTVSIAHKNDNFSYHYDDRQRKNKGEKKRNKANRWR